MLTYWKKYRTIWDINADIKNEFDSEPFYNKTLLKNKIPSCRDEATNFYDKEIP